MSETVTKSIVRTRDAGVFFGEVASRECTPAGVICEIRNCRRIWSWAGAASLNQLASEGSKCPDKCMLTVDVASIEVMGVVEIIPCTQMAIDSLNSVPVWKIR